MDDVRDAMLDGTSIEPTVLGGDWTPWGPRALVTQEKINAFAEISGDFQGIHLNPESARAAGFETTIAHGKLVEAMLPAMTPWLKKRMSSGIVIYKGDSNEPKRYVPVDSVLCVRAKLVKEETAPRNAGIFRTYQYEIGRVVGDSSVKVVAIGFVKLLYKAQ